MNFDDFKNFLVSFAEEPTDVDIRLGRATFQIRDEVFDVQLKFDSDEQQTLLVIENDVAMVARPWLMNRVARLPQLADRLLTSLAETAGDNLPFVTPNGLLSPDLAVSESGENLKTDAVEGLLSFATTKLPGATSVLYLTSDAGEGKTTVISRVAYRQAQRYKAREVASLVVPIPLSGRAFLTFDDAVIAALVNKLRFNYFYFDAFLALVRLGALVPAFDGYEEMLVEGSKGEAVSALGGLVQSLDSSGAVIIAARKAFFDYVSFKSQAKLLDAIGSHSASFSRLELLRWSRDQFIDYGRQRNLPNPEGVYSIVEGRLGSEHPLLTRAVLVSRLFDVTESEADRNRLAELLGANPQDYFFTFVDAIVKREATEKWLARITGDVMEPLLTVEEHHELLAAIAIEMWQSSARSLKFDVLDVLVDIYAESRKKSGIATRQIRERVKQHSLLATDKSKGASVSFDHEDFQDFYLGEGLGRLLAAGNRADLYSALSVNVLSDATVEQSIQYLHRVGADLAESASLIKRINVGESGFSFCKENCGLLAMRMVEYLGRTGEQHCQDMYFSTDSLLGRGLSAVTFESCHFQPSGLAGSKFHQIYFRKCEFERLDLVESVQLAGCEFSECRFDSIFDLAADEHLFDPARIDERLRKAGALVADGQRDIGASAAVSQDEALKVLNRFLRIFLRTTQVNEDVVRLRLGSNLAPKFFDEILPRLMAKGILNEVTWDGRGVQRRYRLAVPMAAVNKALEDSEGSFEGFLSAFDWSTR